MARRIRSAPRGKGRPRLYDRTRRIPNTGISPETADRLDRFFRANRDPDYTTSDAVRALVEIGLDTYEQGQPGENSVENR